ncbi:pyridoxal phosphate-dependent aminotransferase [Methyloterricola oryzae]|uniref:pyridoxal phosphate-dependent aminotransferase n=1 Tax=Methyloterricola oryzae TaxID=1495050 RepID=UPI000A50870C|nr:pyridoxal phosphate-dependent aminotransferase [Methyloterricola oryzae]
MKSSLPPASRRMAEVQSPIIPVVGEWIRQTPGCISLGQGVAFYGPPPQALERARAFGDQPDCHKYGSVQGQPELLKLIGAKLVSENGLDLDGRRVVVTAGANMAFLNALFAIADPGDEVILPTPFYFNQEMAIRMLGCTPVCVPTDAAYQPDPECIRAALTPRTRAVVTVSPNNPSGAVYPEAVLRAINALCAERGIYHICDEAYEYFTYGDARHYSPGAAARSQAHTISLYSLSKAYGFASWRIGYMVFPEHLHEAVLKAQDTNLICATRIAQEAAMGALEAGPGYARSHLASLEQTRDQILAALHHVNDLCRVTPTQGAFYLMLEVDTDLSSERLAEKLVREHGVAVIPGAAFGLCDRCCFRISYGALRPETAVEGVRRLVDGLRRTQGLS